MKQQAERMDAAAPAASSVDDLCERWKISRGHFYALRRTGRGPRTVKIGKLTRITREDEDAWQRSLREAAG